MSNVKNEFKKNGFVISKPIINEIAISEIREQLNKEFHEKKNYKGVALEIDQFEDLDLAKNILNILFSDETKKIIRELEDLSSEPVSLLPPVHVHKNYHLDQSKTLGWHRDCGGELKHNYCKKKIYSKNYLFSKVGIYLQTNSEIGGSIDIIQSSHKNFSFIKTFLRKINSIPLKLVLLLHKYFKNIYFQISENFFMQFIKAKRLYPQKSSAVFFDSRLIHRGSPVARNKIKEIKYTDKANQINLPKNFTKYVIYSHFGNKAAVDSYMHDRLKRKGNDNELHMWLNQIDFIAKLNKDLSEQMRLVIGPLLNKYKS